MAKLIKDREFAYYEYTLEEKNVLRKFYEKEKEELNFIRKDFVKWKTVEELFAWIVSNTNYFHDIWCDRYPFILDISRWNEDNWKKYQGDKLIEKLISQGEFVDRRHMRISECMRPWIFAKIYYPERASFFEELGAKDMGKEEIVGLKHLDFLWDQKTKKLVSHTFPPDSRPRRWSVKCYRELVDQDHFHNLNILSPTPISP